MQWSYRVARVAGIDIKIHATFFLIVLLFAAQWGFVHGTPGAAFGALLIAVLFVCVTLHELGHALTARAVGIGVREIILLPLGGLALLERNATRPLHELLIALAGPAVNVIIVMVLAPIVVLLTGDLTLLSFNSMLQGLNTTLSLTTFLDWLLEANILLVLFNMLPAFPLDGGRVLRALLAMVLGFRRATRIASRTGQVFAILLGLLAVITFDIFLGLIALLIYFGAGQEQSEEQTSTVLSTRRVGDAYNKHVLTLSIGDRVSKVIDYVLTSYQPDFAVLQGNRLLGIITRDDMLRAMANTAGPTYLPDTYVTTVMQREVVRVAADNTLDQVRQTMVENNVRVVAVYEGDMYLGLVNMDDIAEAFTVLTFTERYKLQRQPPDSPTSSSATPDESGLS